MYMDFLFNDASDDDAFHSKMNSEFYKTSEL
jgi:hypothetical protein